jgi:hypothetical protein
MKKRTTFLASHKVLDVVRALKEYRQNRYSGFAVSDWPRATAEYPHVKVMTHECGQCHDGHIKVTYDFLKPDQKGKMKKESLAAYADRYDSAAFAPVKTAIGEQGG